MLLILSVLDLVVEPGVVEDLDLVLGHELPEDQGEPAEQEQPEPGGRRRPAGTVRLAPAVVGGRRGVSGCGGRFSMRSHSVPRR